MVALIDVEVELCTLPSAVHQPTFSTAIAGKRRRTPLQWTDQITDLVELCYALSAKGSLNEGRASTKEIIYALSDLFGVSLKNYWKTFAAIRTRQGDRAFYLCKLHDALTLKMDDLDK